MRLMPEFWIEHPACGEPVNVIRWLAFKIGDRMESWGRRLTWWAIDPEDEIPF